MTETKLRHGRHCVFKMHVHLVFVTKYRHNVFTSRHLNALNDLFQEICVDFEGTLVEFNGEQDHVHLLVEYPPKVAVSKLVNSLKGVSSRILKRDYPELKTHYYNGRLWSPSYFAGSCGGAPITILKTYIQNQQHPKP